MKIPQNIVEKSKEIIVSEDFKNKVKNILTEDYDPNNFELYMDEDVKYPKEIVEDFINFCMQHLGIADTFNLKVVLSSEKDRFETYAFYDIQNKLAAVYAVRRAILDCFRSLAHELVHHKQNLRGEITNEQTSTDNDGVPIEDEANAVAGVIMRKFGRLHPELY